MGLRFSHVQQWEYVALLLNVHWKQYNSQITEIRWKSGHRHQYLRSQNRSKEGRDPLNRDPVFSKSGPGRLGPGKSRPANRGKTVLNNSTYPYRMTEILCKWLNEDVHLQNRIGEN